MDNQNKLLALIVAGGLGVRAGFRKQYAMLAGEPVLIRSCKAVAQSEMVTALAVSVPEEDIQFVRDMLEQYKVDKVIAVIAGGAQRQDTVRIALEKFVGQYDFILVHDAARPLVDKGIVEDVITKAYETSAAIAAVPAKDTTKLIDIKNGFVVATPPRETVYQAQTPQVFSYDVLMKAHAKALENAWLITDDSSAVELMGIQVSVVEGSQLNMKLTTKDDFVIAQAMLTMK